MTGVQTCALPISREGNSEDNIDNNIELNEVIISTYGRDENLTKLNMGVQSLSVKEINKIPAMMGEVDVIKAIQLLPGVQPTSDGGSGFSVRGGSADQNLIMLDNSTVYNASHLLGIFSVFNNDVISGLDLYKGDMPLKFGGRLSSMLDIRTRDDHPERFSMVGGIGLISSRLVIDTPIGDKTSIMVGARRSYADLFLRMNKDYKDYDLYFYDTNAKITHRFSSKDKIEINGYYGKDLFGMAGIQSFGYGNSTASATWGHIFNSTLFSKLSLNYSGYDYFAESEMENSEMLWDASLRDFSLRYDITQPYSNLLDLSYGVSGTFHKFKPALVRQPGYDDFLLPPNYSFEYSAYIENKQKISDRLSLRYGVRFTSFNNIGKNTLYSFDNNYECTDTINYKRGDVYNTYIRFEPRAGIVYQLTQNSSVKANYVHNVQFIQLANNSAAGSPMDMWFSASPNIKPQEADIFSAGYFHNFNDNMYELSCELYYKDYKNVIDFADHAELLLNELLEGEIRTGKGRAYGMELMVKKNTGKLNGFANYTLSRSERTIAGINNGNTYLAPFDKTHCVNIALNYILNKKHAFSAAWIYASGNPTTYPVGRMEINGEFFPIYSGRNEYRRPDYHRLDVSYTFTPKPETKKRWRGEWNFSLFNAYNQHNPWTISYDSDENGPYAEMVYLFGLLPSVTYNFKF